MPSAAWLGPPLPQPTLSLGWEERPDTLGPGKLRSARRRALVTVSTEAVRVSRLSEARQSLAWALMVDPKEIRLPRPAPPVEKVVRLRSLG